MLYNEVKKVIRLDEEREITISTGKYAKQADGSVIVQQGDTMLLATVCAAKDVKDDCDFMPLSVEYREKYAAAGRYPGGFLKREARPSDSEIWFRGSSTAHCAPCSPRTTTPRCLLT